MTATLVTGANKGLGKETARRLIAAGHAVWIGARDATHGQATADALGARFVALDVTDDRAVATLAAAGGIDVLIDDAGIIGAMSAAELEAKIAPFMSDISFVRGHGSFGSHDIDAITSHRSAEADPFHRASRDVDL